MSNASSNFRDVNASVAQALAQRTARGRQRSPIADGAARSIAWISTIVAGNSNHGILALITSWGH